MDFFAQEFNTVHVSNSNASLGSDAYISKNKEEASVDESAGPRVDHIDSVAHETAPPPSVILKKPVKKPAAAAKKGGLGAQKVKVNFSELEQRAAEMEKEAEVGKIKDNYLEKKLQEKSWRPLCAPVFINALRASRCAYEYGHWKGKEMNELLKKNIYIYII